MDYKAVDVQTILEYFGEDKIKDRFKFIYDKFLTYIAERNLQDKIIINKNLLQQAVIDYFSDIYRLKKFHGINNINMTKIVAYEAYWLLKRKPLQIVLTDTDTRLTFINEGFITTFIAHEFLMPDDVPLSDDKKEAFLKFLKHLHYCLKYRELNKQSLESVLFAFETGKEVF